MDMGFVEVHEAGFGLKKRIDNHRFEVGRGRNKRTVPCTLYRVIGMLPRGGSIQQTVYSEHHIAIFKSGKSSVQSNITFPTVRPKYGLLAGTNVSDPEGTEAAMSKLALRWLGTKVDFQPPRVAMSNHGFISKVVDSNGQLIEQRFDITRDCTKCRWFRSLRFGSDEFISGFDFSDENGECLRLMPKSNYDRGVSSEHVCALFGTYVEETFDIVTKLNTIGQCAQNNGLVNIREGYDSWPIGISLRRKHLGPKAQPVDPDDVAPPQETEVKEVSTTDPTGEWGSENWLRRIEIESRHCEYHRERSNYRTENIPAMWMPESGKDVVAPGGIHLRLKGA